MITYLIIHLVLGAIGAVIVTKLELNKGLDFTLNDLVLSVLLSITTGPFLFIIAVLYYSFGKPSRVLIKGEKK